MLLLGEPLSLGDSLALAGGETLGLGLQLAPGQPLSKRHAAMAPSLSAGWCNPWNHHLLDWVVVLEKKYIRCRLFVSYKKPDGTAATHVQFNAMRQ